MPLPMPSRDAFRAALAEAPPPDAAAAAAARARDAVLTKPPGALGRLEEIALWHAEWLGPRRGPLRRPQIVVFAGEHGVAARGVSAFPSEVTGQMVANFRTGGAAINQLARVLEASLDVVALAPGLPTADFTARPAMDEAGFLAALNAGWDAVDPEADLLIPGEMGIGATTAAAALCCALFGGAPADWVGRGTGVDDDGLARKTQVVAEALATHGAALSDPLEALRRLGGREMAAMAGAIAGARARRVPVLLDGFICCAAAAALARATPGALAHCRAGHVSAERAHPRLLAALGMEPLLDLGLRLGEGSGAAAAALLVKAALACHHGMASFAEAGVSEG
ncbi:MAG: nicotinate-nucleotide--dimethylbenzimidazole phosphoribosyltransferase [Rubrimonas sp.]|uniref:nicotinate-nucleotide--dimethylbenzimidazole phosphoribosyltransferase n=1 Tax=Rubrimonas sp. TaxID=2036015 RepID=UPI002FDD553E